MSAPQTVDEVIAIVRMRVACALATGSMFPPSAVAAMADLVEAVARPPSHDAAALRAALIASRDFIIRIDRAFNPFMQNLLEKAVEKADAALAAPARNCDRPECADVESAWATYCSETNRADCTGFARWLFSTAKKGAKR